MAVIKLKRSSTPSSTPSTLDDGELAINIADNTLFWKDSDGIIHRLYLVPPTDTSDNSARLASTQFVHTLLNALVGNAPASLNTLEELAAAIGNNPNYATSIINLLAGFLRFDIAQSLTGAQLAQAQANLGFGPSSYTYYAMTEANPIVVNFNNGFNQSVTLTANRNLGPPTNFSPGQSGLIKVAQDATGNRTLGFTNGSGAGATYWTYDGDNVPIIGGTANKFSLLSWHAYSTYGVFVGLAGANMTVR